MVSRISTRRYLIALVAVLAFALSSGGSENSPSDIKVELDSQKPLTLNVTVRSHSETRVALAKWRLPWGNQRSMLMVPVSRDGECIDNKYFAEEYPEYEKVSIDANGTVSGKIDLQKVIPELREALKKSDVHLFWTYKAPEELRIAQWSGGWILIPQQK